MTSQWKDGDDMEIWKDIQILECIPEGWQVLIGATTAPKGYRFICNNKSRWSNERKTALVAKEIADEWIRDNSRQGNSEGTQ